MKAELKVDVEELVKETIEVSLAEALNKRSGSIVQEIVRHALRDKPTGYGGKTILEAALTKAIRDQAQEAIATWLKDHHLEIQVLVGEQIRVLLDAELVAANITRALKGYSIELAPFGCEDNGNSEEEAEVE